MFCLQIPQETLKCCEESKTIASMELEAFLAKLFAAVTAFKAAYAELQMAQVPYNKVAIQSADKELVRKLRAISELKRRYLKRQIVESSPRVTLMLAEIQEQQSLMKIYEITMKQMKAEIEIKNSQISSLHKNKSLEKIKSFPILENIKFSDGSIKDFVIVLRYALRPVRKFVKLLIREMEKAEWDIEAAVNAIQPGIVFSNIDHKVFVFESFVCREMFTGFGFEFSIDEEKHQRRVFFFEQFKNMRSVSVRQFLKHFPSNLFQNFLKSKYLNLVHPKMEFSFFGNLNQRKMVDSGDIEWPESEFFEVFAEMGRRVWLLHCLASSFDQEIEIFQVKENSRFCEVYMESVTEDVFAAAAWDLRAAFTVVPGFKFGQTVVHSQVYLLPSESPAKG